MKIALAQMEVISGRPKKNLEKMLKMIEQAKRERVDLIAFPEMCVGGYLLGDKWLEDSFCLNLMEFNEAIRKSSKGIAIAYGNVFVESLFSDKNYHPNKDGRSRKYNAVYVFQNEKPVSRIRSLNLLPEGVQPKTLLPNYRFFDDERYFFSLKDVARDYGVSLESLIKPFLIEVDGKKVPVGFELCEDLWCEDYREKLQSLNPTNHLIKNGAEYIVNLSASPWTFGKNSARDKRIQFLKKESGKEFVPFLYVNCAGAQNNGKNIVTFDGGSTVYNKEGLPVVLSKAPYLEELIVVEDPDFNKPPVERKETSKIAQKYDALITGIRHVKNIRGSENQPKYVIGLSGGIDSAIVASLLTFAVGHDNVLAINIPTKYNSEKTKRVASHVAEKLCICYEVIPIGELVKANEELLEKFDLDDSGRKLSSLNQENLQAKVRGTSILSNLAAKYNALFTNNGNKLEIALGYATLYGDVGGAVSPIGDLTKAEVYELARYINDRFRRDIIPEELIPDELFRFRKDQIAPSAELKDAQIDPMKFGYHDALLEVLTDYKKKTPEDFMKWYLEGTLEKNLSISAELIKLWELDNPKTFVEDLDWFARAVNNNVFKRVQSPPIIITSKSAYGYDIRESMLPNETTLEYDRLKQEVLTMKKYEGEK